MAILKIAQVGHPILSKRANPIRIPSIKTKITQDIIENMVSTLKEEGGVGLAAPQIFELKRIITIQAKPTKKSFRKTSFPLTIIVNPIILEKSEEKNLDWEACLSISHGRLWAVVPRSTKILIEGFDKKAKKMKLWVSGYKARVIQHEIDHLEGISFLQRIREKDYRYLSTFDNWATYHKNHWPEPRPLK